MLILLLVLPYRVDLQVINRLQRKAFDEFQPLTQL